MKVCTSPGCPELTTGGPCPQHRTARPTAAARGYDHTWRKNRARYIKAHPTCILCGADSQHADHWPHTRRTLIAAQDPHPDAWHHLRPLCHPCHSRETATHHGSFGRPPRQPPHNQR